MPSAHPREEPVTKLRWYGYLPLATDMAAVSLVLAGGKAESAPIAGLGLGTFVLGGPLMHGMRGNWGRAGASLALRVVLPAAGLWYGAFHCSPHNCGNAVVGVVAPIAAASLLDAAALSWERVPVQPRVSPSVAVTKDQFVVGASGTF